MDTRKRLVNADQSEKSRKKHVSGFLASQEPAGYGAELNRAAEQGRMNLACGIKKEAPPERGFPHDGFNGMLSGRFGRPRGGRLTAANFPAGEVHRVQFT